MTRLSRTTVVDQRRRWSRLDRVSEVLREVIADELERVDDDRLALVTVTGVRVDPDLRHARVWFSSLSGGRAPAEVEEALADQRVRLKAAVAHQVRLKRTPELTFQPDPAIAVGARVEEILRGLKQGGHSGPPSAVEGSPSSAEGDAHE